MCLFHQSRAPQLPQDVPADASILCDKSVMPDETVKRMYDVNFRPDLLLSRFCQ